eukprot:3002547-Prymnesium_polylepis.2
MAEHRAKPARQLLLGGKGRKLQLEQILPLGRCLAFAREIPHEIVQVALALKAERLLVGALLASHEQLDRRDGAFPVVARIAVVGVRVAKGDSHVLVALEQLRKLVPVRLHRPARTTSSKLAAVTVHKPGCSVWSGFSLGSSCDRRRALPQKAQRSASGPFRRPEGLNMLSSQNDWWQPAAWHRHAPYDVCSVQTSQVDIGCGDSVSARRSFCAPSTVVRSKIRKPAAESSEKG